MNKELIEKQVRAVVAKSLLAQPGERPAQEIFDELSLADDLGCDSLDNVELCMALEEEFAGEGLLFSDDEMQSFRTVGDLVKLTCGKLGVE